jgi:predicted secreted protein
MATGAIAALGAKVQHNISGSYVSLPETLSITTPTPDSEDIDVTSLDSLGGYREFIQGFKTAGEFSFTGNFIPGSASQTALQGAYSAGTTYGWKILLPSGSVLCSFAGNVKKYQPTGFEAGSQVKYECTVKVTGAVTWGS